MASILPQNECKETREKELRICYCTNKAIDAFNAFAAHIMHTEYSNLTNISKTSFRAIDFHIEEPIVL